MYKVGDKLICKRIEDDDPWFWKETDVLEIGKEYTILSIINVISSNFVAKLYTLSCYTHAMFNEDGLKYCFYTKRELRKLKLERLKNV